MDTGSGQTTVLLLRRAQAGEAAAREALFARMLPLLQRWAHGRLPGYARDLNETGDLVQTALLRALRRLDDFDAQGTGAFLAYLRQILLNTVRDELRRQGRRPFEQPQAQAEELPDNGPSIIESLLGAEQLARYEQALERLPETARQLVLMRVEFGMSYVEIAAETGSSADAVRMSVRRAVQRIERELADGPA